MQLRIGGETRFGVGLTTGLAPVVAMIDESHGRHPVWLLGPSPLRANGCPLARKGEGEKNGADHRLVVNPSLHRRKAGGDVAQSYVTELMH